MLAAVQSYERFLERLGAKGPTPIIDGRRLFYDPRGLRDDLIKRKIEVYSAGIFLGEVQRDFRPSPGLLPLLEGGRRVRVGKKSEWLFLCGRDVLAAGLTEGEPKRGQFIIVENDRGEVLGIGEWLVDDIDDGPAAQHRPVIRNILDLGAYLRREMR